MKTEKSDQFERIAEALERLAPKKKDFPDFDKFSAFITFNYQIVRCKDP